MDARPGTSAPAIIDTAVSDNLDRDKLIRSKFGALEHNT